MKLVRSVIALLLCAPLLYCGRAPAEAQNNGGLRAPEAPSAVKATPGNAKADVRWEAPPAQGQNALTSNTVTSSPDDVVVTVPGSSTNATVAPLVNGTSYTFTVHATNAAGSSPESAPSASVTPRTVPGAPTITGVVPADSQVAVSWTPPASDGGSAITGYSVVASPGGIRLDVGAVTTATVTGLTNGLAYTFTVQASNAAGAGPFSAASAAVTPRTVPGAPTGVSASAGDGQATVSWSAPASNGGSAIESYTATASPGGASATVTGTSAVVTGLTNGTSYTFTVVAANAAGPGPASAPSAAVVPRTLPGAPTGVLATADDGKALLSWVAPASDGGSPITGYVITASPGGGTMSVGNVTSATFSGLTNGTSYTFTVAAINDAGTGPASAPSGAVVPRGPPGAPQNVSATPGDAFAVVSWTAPTSNGGSPIVSYTVTASPGGATVSVNASVTSAQVTGLANGTAYTFTVFATNAAGNGQPSAPSAAVTPRRVPDAPTNVSATPGDTQATVSWSAPAFNGGAPIETYTITASPVAPGVTTGGNNTSAPVTGLTNGTSYTFSVYATNVAGDGFVSAPSLPVTPMAGPGLFPVLPSANHRYLVDFQNRPFRIQGDAAYSLIANLTFSEAQQYVTDRQARGFNSLLVNLLEHKFAVNAPKNRNGDPPFTTPGDFSTPNEAYFAFADSIIDLAASKGMLVFLEYLYLGVSGSDEGWSAELTNSVNNQTNCHAFGQYLGNRYKNRSNIVWITGGDYTPLAGSEAEKRVLQIMQGIRDAGATQIASAHWAPNNNGSDHLSSILDLNSVYQYAAQYAGAASAYSFSPALPTFLLETGYELENIVPGDRASIRKYEYWSALGGAIAGVFYGHRDIWQFAPPWQQALNSPGAQDMTRMHQLYDSIAWQSLVPSGLSGMRTLVTSTTSSDHVVAAAAPDGTVLLAYVPPTGTSAVSLTVDMSGNTATRSRWYDPSTGAYTLDSTSLPGTGSRTFTTPGANGSGANDWVLVLDRG